MLNKNDLEIAGVAFEGTHRGYRFKCYYLKNHNNGALAEISKDGKTIKEFLCPAYKVWNVAAHANDIVDGIEAGNDNGLVEAGSDGLGGSAYIGGEHD